MAIVEAVMVLVGPILEFALPLVFYLVEAIIWLFLLVAGLIKSLIMWRKPVVPMWVSLVGVRAKTKSAATRWQQFRRRKIAKSKKS